MLEQERLEAGLRELGANLDLPGVDLGSRVSTTLGRRKPLIRPAWVAAALLLLVVAVLAIEPARTVVATWLGIGRTVVVPKEALDLSELPSSVMVLGEPAEVATAEAVLGRSLPESSLLGPPPIVLVDEQRVTMVWRSPLLSLTPLRGGGITRKLAAARGVEQVVFDGRRALWIGEAHRVELPDHPPALSARVLLWEWEGLEWRLETILDREEAVAVDSELTE
jgi:hypothetical protein